MVVNHLFYGDNLVILRELIADQSIDLCYADPPYNSGKKYYAKSLPIMIFNDSWCWDDQANRYYQEILDNHNKRFNHKTISLISCLSQVLGFTGNLAYVINLTLRLVEIYRVLKVTGTLFVHCDPNYSHYLKVILDSIFWPKGVFINEIIWCYKDPSGKSIKHFRRKHDVILCYAKSSDYYWDGDSIRVPYSVTTNQQIAKKTLSYGKPSTGHPLGKIPEDWWVIPMLNSQSHERLGYPTQKPIALLDRIIKVASQPGDLILDPYGGSGTTVMVAQVLNRSWIACDRSAYSITMIKDRLKLFQ